MPGSEPDHGVAGAADLGGAAVETATGLAGDQLNGAAGVPGAADRDRMTHRPQFLDDGRVEARFDADGRVAVWGLGLVAEGEAGRLDRSLGVETEVDQVGQDLDVGLDLPVGAGGAADEDRLAVLVD